MIQRPVHRQLAQHDDLPLRSSPQKRSIDAVTLRNNAALVAKAARGFKVSTILTTVAEKSFSGPIFDEIKSVFPEHNVIDRTSMNTWEDERIAVEVNAFGKQKIVLAGLWTSVCIVGPALPKPCSVSRKAIKRLLETSDSGHSGVAVPVVIDP